LAPDSLDLPLSQRRIHSSVNGAATSNVAVARPTDRLNVAALEHPEIVARAAFGGGNRFASNAAITRFQFGVSRNATKQSEYETMAGTARASRLDRQVNLPAS
jgi:hypothetical protein